MFPLQLWRQQLLMCDQSNRCVMTSHTHTRTHFGFNFTETHTSCGCAGTCSHTLSVIHRIIHDVLMRPQQWGCSSSSCWWMLTFINEAQTRAGTFECCVAAVKTSPNLGLCAFGVLNFSGTFRKQLNIKGSYLYVIIVCVFFTKINSDF